MVPAPPVSRFALVAFRSTAYGILLAFSLAARVLAGDIGGWKSLGPRVPGGIAWTVAVDPHSGAVLAGGPSGVSRSTDGGATWTDSSTGLTFLDVRSLAIDPRTSSVAYAGTSGGGVFKSVDAGTSWSQLASSPASAPLLAIAPLTPSVLYAAGSGSGVYKSTDAGATWSLLASVPVRDIFAIAVDPGASGTVWVGGQWDLTSRIALARTVDGGISWSPIPLGTSPLIVETIAIASSSPTAVYVGQIGAGLPPVLGSTDGGATWASVSDGLPTGIVPLSLAVDPHLPLTVYLGWNGGFSRSTNGGIHWETAPQGPGLPAGGGGPSGVPVIAVDPGSPGVLYAVTADEGAVFRSADAGATWVRRPGIFRDVGIGALATDPSDPRTVYATRAASTGDSGLFKTTDGGASWSFRRVGAGTAVTYITDLVIDPATPATIYVATYGGGVLKSVDGGTTLAPSNTGLPLDVAALAIAPGGGSNLYASTQSGVFRTVDGGATWSQTGPSDRLFNRLAVAGTTAPTLYGSNGLLGLWKSTDGGVTFSSVTTGLTGVISAILVDPANPSVVYVSSRSPYFSQPIFFFPTDNGVARTTDGGLTWEVRNSGLASTDVNALALDPRNTTHLFAATYLGVSASNSSGIGWFSVDDGLTSGAFGVYVNALAVDGSVPPNLYAGTTNLGVFRRSATILPSPCAADATTLCLQGGRFRTRVTWSAASFGGGAGQAMSLTPDTGAFWFFSPNNLELVVKVVDGRAFNDHFWVFAGALSDVEYVIEVTDTSTGAVRTYRHAGGTPPESVGDAAAF